MHVRQTIRLYTLSLPSLCVLTRVQLLETPWTVAYWVPLFMEFSRQECWSRLPFPTPGDFPDPGIKPASLESPVLAGGFFTTELLFFLNVSSVVCQLYLNKPGREKRAKEECSGGSSYRSPAQEWEEWSISEFPAESSASQPRPWPDQGRGEG